MNVRKRNQFINILLIVFFTLMFWRPTPTRAFDKTDWFVESRFGLFIHFGLYSVPAGVWDGQVMGRNMYAEWMQKQGNWPYGIPDADYQVLVTQFNPKKFNADVWVLEAKNAGMRYMLITAKHHDGFALWPSDASEYDVMATPFQRDILGELAEACQKYGLKLGFYYSHWQDWEHPGGARPPIDEFKSVPLPLQVSDADFEVYWQEKCLPQVQELIEKYRPAFLWFDTWGKPDIITDERLEELINHVRRLDPTCLINSRILMKHPEIANKVDFLSMGDNSFPKEKIDKPWETSGTMNRSWGYHQKDNNWEDTASLLRKLAGNVSRNGNFQLNVGPKADGSFPKPTVRRLREIGAWMAVNGEAIYGAKPNPFREQNWGTITWREKENGTKRLYLHVFDWPENREIKVSGLDIVPSDAFILETEQKVEFVPDHGSMVFSLPSRIVDEKITVIVVDVPNW